MLLTKEVEMTWNNMNKDYYINKGYIFTKIRNLFWVKVSDLPKGSNVKVKVKCDGDNCNIIKDINWSNYVKRVCDKDKYYCVKCANKTYGAESKRLNILKNGMSFEIWCIENNRQDILERWDYELNKYKPSEINCNTEEKYYFKCPRCLHKSELRHIFNLVSNKVKTIHCKTCNSFAQWGIDNLGEDFLEEYWDWERNNIIKINPWIINKSSKKTIYIKCQINENHESYKVACHNFVLGKRCPVCNISKGEYKIKQLLDNKKINYEYEKTYNGLFGINNGSLSYDFYLHDYNLLIEYQGLQHEKPVDFQGKGKIYSQKQFKIQQEHDRRKREYAKTNNINLLEIWYWDYDNIEEILTKELNKYIINF